MIFISFSPFSFNSSLYLIKSCGKHQKYSYYNSCKFILPSAIYIFRTDTERPLLYTPLSRLRLQSGYYERLRLDNLFQGNPRASSQTKKFTFHHSWRNLYQPSSVLTSLEKHLNLKIMISHQFSIVFGPPLSQHHQIAILTDSATFHLHHYLPYHDPTLFLEHYQSFFFGCLISTILPSVTANNYINVTLRV